MRRLLIVLAVALTAALVPAGRAAAGDFTQTEVKVTMSDGVHIAASYYHDVEPCLKEKVPVIWVNRKKETLEPSQRKPTAEVKTLTEAMKLLEG